MRTNWYSPCSAETNNRLEQTIRRDPRRWYSPKQRTPASADETNPNKLHDLRWLTDTVFALTYSEP